jgi:membrane-bound lytic murein transglycosylase D
MLAEPAEVVSQSTPDAAQFAGIDPPVTESAEEADAASVAIAVEDASAAPTTQPTVDATGSPAMVMETPGSVADTTSGVAATASETRPEEAAELIAEVVEDASPSHISDGLIARVEQAEPVSAEEAEEIAPALPLTVQPDLSADPSDYSVVANDSIEVQAAETLGHYAEWLELRAWRLRQLNGMRYKQPVVIGQRLSLDFSQVSATDFEHRRLDYHRSLQASFFQRSRIAGTSTHVIRQGESLWILARRTYDIPIWLLRQYNPDLDFDAVAIGVTVTVPRVESLGEEPVVARTTTAKAN